MDEGRTGTEAQLKHAVALAEHLATSNSSGRIESLKRIVARVTVHRDQVDIAVRPCNT